MRLNEGNTAKQGGEKQKQMRSLVEESRDLLTRCRKCLLLLNPLHPIADLLSPKPATASEILLHLIDLASAISDDLFCLSKLGLVSRRLGKKADLWSKWVSFPPPSPPPPFPPFHLSLLLFSSESKTDCMGVATAWVAHHASRCHWSASSF